jgi:hypothetical protein
MATPGYIAEASLYRTSGSYLIDRSCHHGEHRWVMMPQLIGAQDEVEAWRLGSSLSCNIPCLRKCRKRCLLGQKCNCKDKCCTATV